MNYIFTIFILLLVSMQTIYVFGQKTKISSRRTARISKAVSTQQALQQTVNWETQGITFSLPVDWRKDDENSAESYNSNSYLGYKNARNQSMYIAIGNRADGFPEPEELMLTYDFISQRDLIKSQLEKPRLREINGVNGSQFVFLQNPSEARLTWQTYRHYQGKAQSVFISLRGAKKDLEALRRILNTVKVSRDERNEPIVKAALSDAQKQMLAKGQVIQWAEQDISIALPVASKEDDGYVSNQSPLIRLRRYWSRDLSLTIDITAYHNELEQMKYSLARDYAFLRQKQKEGKIKEEGSEAFVQTDEVRYLELDGIKGIEMRRKQDLTGEGNVSSCLRWTGYRMLKTKPQTVDIEICSPDKQFSQNKEIFCAVLHSVNFE